MPVLSHIFAMGSLGVKVGSRSIIRFIGVMAIYSRMVTFFSTTLLPQ